MSGLRTLEVVLATADAPWEARLVSELGHRPDVHVVRRCVDLPDLLATVATSAVDAALVAPELHRLDRDAVARVAEQGVALVGIAAPTDSGADRLAALELPVVSPSDATGEIVAALVAAVARAGSARTGRRGQPPASATALREPSDDTAVRHRSSRTAEPRGSDHVASGALVAVWGPVGAPGRTTLAVNLAAEAARAGTATLLADADTYGPSIAQHLGMLDESAGIAAAVRQAGAGSLTAAELVRHTRALAPQWTVLTGLTRAGRWPELRPAALASVWATARQLASMTIVDTSYAVEEDEELSFDVAAPRRNAATIDTLAAADAIVVVGRADPIGLQRLVRALTEVADVAPMADRIVVVNRTRRSLHASRSEITAMLHRLAGVDEIAVVPDDPHAVDAALAAGRALADVAPRSGARTAIRDLAARIVRTYSRQVEKSSSRPATV